MEEEYVSAAARTITPRIFSGISAHHSKTPKGVKLHMTFQDEADASNGVGVNLTAELKRKDRFREIKEYSEYEPYFKEFVTHAIKEYGSMKANYAIGRVHERKEIGRAHV